MNRLVEADMVRTAAIALVVLTHLPDYFPLPSLGSCTAYTVLFGNGLFIFLSGYLTHSVARSRGSSISTFMGRRLMRLMPLYWLALAVFTVVVVRPDPATLALHAAGLQVVLAPVAVTPLPTLWFVGMVLLFYLIYRLAVAPRADARSMALVAAAALLPLIAVRVVLGAPEVRFFLYYFVFMAGAVVRQTGLLDSLRTKGAAVILVSAVISLGAFIAAGGPAIDEGPTLSAPSTVALMAVINIMIVSWALLAWMAARWAAPRLGTRAAGGFAACSAASYFVYLFHRPALVLTTSVLERAGVAWSLQLLAVLAAVLPALFLAGRAVQRPLDIVAGRVLERVRGSAPR